MQPEYFEIFIGKLNTVVFFGDSVKADLFLLLRHKINQDKRQYL